jgi:hypothetical protein
LIILAAGHAARAQQGPPLDWVATPLPGFAEFHGLLPASGGLLAWGDAGPDTERRAQVLLLSPGADQATWMWMDTLPRSRFHAARTAADGFLLAGEANRGDLTRPLLMKVDEAGAVLWSSEPDWGGAGALHALAPLAMGGWVVAGERNHQALLARLNEEGDTLWTREFEFFPGYDDVFYDVEELADGRIVACGQTFHDSHEWTSRYAVLAWFDPAGGLLDLFQPYDAQMFALEPLTDGRLAVTGEFQFAYLPLWLGTNSQDMTHRYFGTRERDMLARDLRRCPDGGLALTGRWQTAAGNLANLLLRVDDQGEELWRAGYDVCGFDMAWGLAPAVDGSFFMAGFCMPSRTAFIIGTAPEASAVAPATPRPPALGNLVATTMGLRLELRPSTTEASPLRLYNLAGQELRRWHLPAGLDRMELVLEGLPAGRYFLRVEAAGPVRSLPFSWIP